MTLALVDAGPLVALFEPDSPAGGHYDALLADRALQLRLHTTWPCIVEAAHFLSPPRRWALLRWVGEGAVTVLPVDPGDLLELLPLMERWTEPPRTDMDLADATLVWAAAQTGIHRVLTIDVRDFHRYRLPDGRRFEIL